VKEESKKEEKISVAQNPGTPEIPKEERGTEDKLSAVEAPAEQPIKKVE